MSNEQLASPSEDGRIPERLPVLPLVGAVVFPHVLVPLAVTDAPSARAVGAAAAGDKWIALVTVRPGRHPGEEAGAEPPFYSVGTLGLILQHVKLPDASLRVLVQGRTRLRLKEFRHDDGVWSAAAEEIAAAEEDQIRVQALQRIVVGQFEEIASLLPQGADEIKQLLGHISDASQLADFIGAHLALDVERKQRLLEEPSVAARLEQLASILKEEQKVLEYGTELQQKLKDEVEKTQKEFWLREQMKVIQQELGEGGESDVEMFRRRIAAAGMPDVAREQAERELHRLERTLEQAPDYQIIRGYLEWLVEMPWSRENAGEIDLNRAREILDRDHYDLEDVKERLIEFLAVRKLNPEQKGPILCFVGPPGVGKTSLGRSIAEALGRAFTRISLGGIRDEAEIRGHRRTYIGALPGRIIRGIRQAGVRDAVFMLDEVDKVGQDFRGDPTAALLEVLDPAQNHTFSDHYLEVPFDLSHVLFIATANTLASVPPALQDRLEVLELPGYTTSEKFEIARRHQIPKQLAAAGLERDAVQIADDALRRLITEYTREAGVRELDRQIARLMRKIALRRVESGAADPVRITVENLEGFAGKRRFEQELAGRHDEVGTATALAYTPAGGQILFVEAVAVPGEGAIHLTGHLGDVMKESAQAAYSYIRSHADRLGIAAARFAESDVHVHVPTGATPKDGPSAGVAMVVALASLFTGRPVRREVAMTGEVTLRGHVLPVGGAKEKLIAAAQAGITTVLLPKRNDADLAEVPEDVRQHLQFILVEDVAQAIDHALRGGRARGDGRVRLAAS
ncbi:MAG TPA: endopeptidase La [Longimicrobiales bacterium]